MTNSRSEKQGGKRERLIASAADLVHRHGVERPTLAQIADEADVPPGNVYYYFKTKDELIEAVIEARTSQVRGLLDTLGRRRSPAARLKALARNWLEFRDMVSRDPRDDALTLISTVQGAALLTSTFRDSEILVSQMRRLEAWIDS